MSDMGVELNLGLESPEISPGPNPTADDLANPYLNSIPEVDRPVVGKYLKGWQGNVTRRFQAIHDEYAPYKELGDPEELRMARQIYDLANEEPSTLVRGLVEAIPELRDEILAMLGGSSSPPVGASGTSVGYNNPWADQGIPDEFAKQFQYQQQIIEAVAMKMMEGDTQNQAAQEDAELEDVLQQLHQQYGDFDEEAVLVKMYQGLDPEQAIHAWNDQVQELINNRVSRRVPPPVLGGNGSVPAGGVEPSKLSDNDRRKYVADMLEAARDQS